MKRIPIVFLIATLVLWSAPICADTSAPIQWITEKEAALPIKETKEVKTDDKQPFDPYEDVSNTEDIGPIIKIEKPEENAMYKDLIDILVRFEKHPFGEPINMDSLKIVYQKLFGIDITDRVRPHINGNHIDAQKVKFPKGDHEFEIIIEDANEIETSKFFSVHVD